ncbi:MAG: hypothetical protein IJB73_01155, partial [Firmicutes bacterium]|nr:hypothetical protein [Bacillota bacterium]
TGYVYPEGAVTSDEYVKSDMMIWETGTTFYCGILPDSPGQTAIVPMYGTLSGTGIDFDISEKITVSSTGGSTELTISDLEISNSKMSKPLFISDIKVTPSGAWNLVSASTDFSAVTVNSNVFSMKCEEHDFSTGSYQAGSIIKAGESINYSFTGGTGKVTKNVDGNIGQAIVTVDAGKYILSKHKMEDSSTTEATKSSVIIVSANYEPEEAEIEWSYNPPVYNAETKIWEFAESHVETIDNQSTDRLSISSGTGWTGGFDEIYIRFPSQKHIWYKATGITVDGPYEGFYIKRINYTKVSEASLSDALDYEVVNDVSDYPLEGWKDEYYWKPLNLIKFTVSGNEYWAEEDTTWTEWISSDFNPGRFHLDAGRTAIEEYLYNPASDSTDKWTVYYDSNQDDAVIATDLIQPGYEYYI